MSKRCDVTLKMWRDSLITECHEPHMAAKFGHGGTANVCIYICMGMGSHSGKRRPCKYAIKPERIDGVICTYGKEN